MLTGDISLNGEKASHEELAAKLRPLVEAGIGVYVLPGNHDINNYAAYRYEGEGRERTESVTAEEFETIYKNCGFAAAASRDKASLSYMVKLNRSVWLFMLDAEQYAEQSPASPISWEASCRKNLSMAGKAAQGLPKSGGCTPCGRAPEPDRSQCGVFLRVHPV